MQYVNQVFNHLGKCQMSNHITELETQNLVANTQSNHRQSRWQA
jgi:hypothetical protein